MCGESITKSDWNWNDLRSTQERSAMTLYMIVFHKFMDALNGHGLEGAKSCFENSVLDTSGSRILGF